MAQSSYQTLLTNIGMMKYIRFLVPCVFLALLGCGSEEPDGGLDEGSGAGLGGQGGDGGEALSVRKVLGKDGGTIAIDGATLDFPPGALSGDQEIRLTRLDEAEVSPLPAGAAFASPPVAFEPHGLAFNAPISVTLDYNHGAGKRFVVPKLDDHGDETWEKGADAEFNDGKATFTISSFSIWDVVEDPDGVFDEEVVEPEPPTNPGSFETGRLSGVVSLEDPLGVVRVTNVSTATEMPYCAAGTLPGDATDGAGLRFDLGQALGSTTDDDYVPDGAGLQIALNPNVGYEHAIWLHTADGGEYCYRSYLSGPTFISWGEFAENCNSETEPVYGGQAIDAITVEAFPSGGVPTDFYFCVAELDDNYLGYFESTGFHGFASAYLSGSATVLSTPGDSPGTSGVCIGDASAPTSSDAVGLVVNLAETVDGDVGTVEPTSEGLDLSVSASFYGVYTDLRVEITDGSSSWCSLLPVGVLTDGADYFIPWDAFHANCNGTGAAYAGAPLETLRIISDGYSYFYSLCLDGLNATVQPVVGYFESGSWHGYPEVTIAGIGVVGSGSNLTWERATDNACIWGQIPAGGTDYMELLAPLAQDTPGGTKGSVSLTQSSLVITTSADAPPLAEEAVVVDDAGVYYCAATDLGTGSVAVPLASFDECGASTTVLPAGANIIAAGIRIGSDAVSVNYFDICLQGLSEAP